MIDVTGWPAMARLWLLLSPFIIGVPGLCLMAYTTLSGDYGRVISGITSNRYLEGIKIAWHDGSFKWRFLLVATVAGVVALPGWYRLTGSLDLNEVKAFPSRLKRRLICAFWLNCVGFCWMMFLWILVKFK